jgi:hypothetical protein
VFTRLIKIDLAHYTDVRTMHIQSMQNFQPPENFHPDAYKYIQSPEKLFIELQMLLFLLLRLTDALYSRVSVTYLCVPTVTSLILLESMAMNTSRA